MLNRDFESFGKYRIIKCFIYQSASVGLHWGFAKFWLHVFLISGLYTFSACLDSKLRTPDRWTLWLDSALKWYYEMSSDIRSVPELKYRGCVKPCPHCRRKVRLFHKSETVWLLWDSLTLSHKSGTETKVRLYCRRKVRLSHFCETVLSLFFDSVDRP